MTETPVAVGGSGDVAAVETPVHEALRARLVATALAGVHLAALASFAVAQPLFDLLGKTPEFFAVRGSTPGEIVLFALAVAFGVPAALVVVELVAAVVAGWLAAGAVHLLLVASLVALFALQLLKRLEPASSGRLLVALAVLAGVLFAAAYARARPVRTVVTVLGAAPLLFLGLFLFGSSVTKLVFPSDARAELALVDARSDTPVVVIVFDEFSTTSLLDRRGRIDARRFPNFARLARMSTWYPDATAVSQATSRALPAILTGKYSEPKSLPTFQDHPQNLFTLLGQSHSVRAFEPITRVCPRAICPRPDEPSLSGKLSSLGSDLSLVYLHVALPKDLTTGLDPVDQAWTNFRRTDRPRTVKERMALEPGWAFEEFVSSIESTELRPPLYFAHINLPHVPYRYLPSGKSYSGFLIGLDGDEWWRGAEWPILQAQQRYLLQVGYVDRLLGRALERLRAKNLLDRSLVVVTADHGVNFARGEFRRVADVRNAAEIAFVPLFVKAPGQRTRDVRRGIVRSVDILPTIAAETGVAIPWETDGRPLPESEHEAPIRIDTKKFPYQTVTRGRADSLRDQIRNFGDGSWSDVFSIGPHPELIGKRVEDLRRDTSRTLRAEVENAHVFSHVNTRGAVLPILLTGRVHRETGGEGPPGRALAIAVNGVICAVARSYAQAGITSFSALIPDRAFSDGRNEVEIFAVRRRESELILTFLRNEKVGPGYELAGGTNPTSIVSPSGSRIPIVTGAVAGYVDIADLEGDYVRFFGWAADVPRQKIRDQILVFADERLVHVVDRTLEGRRSDLGKRLEDAGFLIYLLREEVFDGRSPRIRVFGVVDGVASELGYPRDYRWGPG